VKPTHIQVFIIKSTHGARIKEIWFKSRGSALSFDILHVQIFMQHSRGHDIVEKMLKNADFGWHLFFLTLAGKEYSFNVI